MTASAGFIVLWLAIIWLSVAYLVHTFAVIHYKVKLLEIKARRGDVPDYEMDYASQMSFLMAVAWPFAVLLGPLALIFWGIPRLTRKMFIV